MVKFTLLKQLYYAFDPDEIPEVIEKRKSDIFRRTLNVEHLNLPGIREVEVQERYLPYSRLYRFYFNDEREEADLADIRAKEFLRSFFHYYHPEYLKKDLPEDLSDTNILDCFEVDNMPGYDRGYAYRDLITLEDIRSGKPDRGRQKHGFPGLSFAPKYKDRE